METSFVKFDITPESLIPLGGYINRKGKKAEGIHDKLYGRICLIRDGRKMAAFILLELLCLEQNFVADVKNRIAEISKIKDAEVLLSCTHTHSGPEVRSHKKLPDLNSYLDTLKEKIVAYFKQAEENLRSSEQTSIYYGRAGVEGVCASRLNSNEVIDNNVHVLVFYDKHNELKGCLANFACHPTILNFENMFYSGDLFGEAMKIVEDRHKKVCFITNGAEGDVSTRFTRKSSSFHEVKRLAGRLAKKIEESIISAKPLNIEEILTVSIAFKLKWKKDLPRMKEIDKTMLMLQEKLSRCTNMIPGDLRKIKSRIEGLEVLKNQVAERAGLSVLHDMVNLSGVKLGRIYILTIPGELAQRTKKYIVSKAPEDAVIILLGLSNGYFGYFPTRQMVEMETYEALVSKFDYNATTALKKEVIGLINKLNSFSLEG